MTCTQLEIVFMDENGGIARTCCGAFEDVRAALQAAPACTPDHCEQVLAFEVETASIVWQGSLADAKGFGEQEAKSLPPRRAA